jgi:hypothetical protein
VEVLQESLREVLGADLEIACTAGVPQHTPATPSAAGPSVPADFAPGDEVVPDDPDAPAAEAPAERGDEAALKLVEQQLGGRVVGSSES